MKSIMQEASSIAKAIEQAWTSAGKPREFTVKVFEEPQKNFIGMTTKSAKVGIFFEEEHRRAEQKREKSYQRKQYAQPAPYMKKAEETIQPQSKQHWERERIPVESEVESEEMPEKNVIWSDEMIQKASEWLRQTLETMNLANVPFTTTVEEYQLRFTFGQPLRENPEQERNLFRSFSFLMLQALKRTFKRPLRGFKIVLTR
jgi:predicted RNA-binding protein Jag